MRILVEAAEGQRRTCLAIKSSLKAVKADDE